MAKGCRAVYLWIGRNNRHHEEKVVRSCRGCPMSGADPVCFMIMIEGSSRLYTDEATGGKAHSGSSITILLVYVKGYRKRSLYMNNGRKSSWCFGSEYLFGLDNGGNDVHAARKDL